MSIFEIILLGVALAMDAFAVSVTEGLKMERPRYREAFIIAFFFGAFQSIMPLIGWKLGSAVSTKIDAYDHWVGFILLTIIGINSVREALNKSPDSSVISLNDTDPGSDSADYRLSIAQLFGLAIATSIDALAVGITFAFSYTANVIRASLMIGAVTFLICCFGIFLGRTVGSRFRRKAEIVGGLILIAIGIRILLSGMGIV